MEGSGAKKSVVGQVNFKRASYRSSGHVLVGIVVASGGNILKETK